MISRVRTGSVRGVEAIPVEVEVAISSGLPSFTVVGMAQGAVREGRERVVAALRSSGFDVPNRRVTVNLAPADLPKMGTTFDLPIAVALLAAAGVVDPEATEGLAFMGELGLDGALRGVNGVLPVALECRRAGLGGLVLPAENGAEAGVVDGLEVRTAHRIADVVDALNGERPMPLVRQEPSREADTSRPGVPDLADVRGQGVAKRALTIAAAGGHNVLFVGPPGSGKTMLASRLPGILPPLEPAEAFSVTAIHSVAGLLRGGSLLRERPFRAPHHTVSYAGLVGGGHPIRPGEISLAHGGVLFLDELPEYRRNVLEVLRQPLEDGAIHLARASGAVRFPARFLLVAAMNPCPCGYWGDGTERCRCDPGSVQRYRSRVSGPLVDRIDLHVEVGLVPFAELGATGAGVGSDAARVAVEATRARQAERYEGRPGCRLNAHLDPAGMREHCRPSTAVVRLLQQAVDRLGLSARAYHRVLRVARTLADLDGVAEIRERDVAEAIQYRVLDRR